MDTYVGKLIRLKGAVSVPFRMEMLLIEIFSVTGHWMALKICKEEIF